MELYCINLNIHHGPIFTREYTRVCSIYSNANSVLRNVVTGTRDYVIDTARYTSARTLSIRCRFSRNVYLLNFNLYVLYL